jgi:hypothetical protein
MSVVVYVYVAGATPSAGALRLVHAHISFFLAPRLFDNIDPTSLEGPLHARTRENQAKPHTSQVGPGGHGPNALAPIVPVT